MPRITDPIEVLKVPMPFMARLHLTKWKSFNDSLRRWKFRNGTSDQFVVATHAMRLEINRFMIVTAQVEVEIVEGKEEYEARLAHEKSVQGNPDDANAEDAADEIFGTPVDAIRKDETAVIEKPKGAKSRDAQATTDNSPDPELHLDRPAQKATARAEESE